MRRHMRQTRIPSDGNPRFMKQSVRITGFGSEHFERAVSSAANIGVFMQESIDIDLVDKWSPVRFQTWSALEFTNRYFVHQNIEGDMIPVEFGDRVDADGLLAQISGDKWVHTEENVVSYFQRVSKADGNMECVLFRLSRMTGAQPNDIQVPDLRTKHLQNGRHSRGAVFRSSIQEARKGRAWEGSAPERKTGSASCYTT